MERRPKDDVGHPVPWFVAWIDGVPDFRVIAAGKIEDAIRFGKCWLCGEPCGTIRWFVIGPMCVVNRNTAEPGSHRECAEYAIRACPFMTRPNMVRRTTSLPEDRVDPPGMLHHNPGAAALYAARTKGVRPYRAGDGVLFELPEPVAVSWWVHGRPATRTEVDAALAAGLPALEAVAREDPPGALEHLAGMVAQAQAWLPAAGAS
jgi:hypothetical protein